MCFSIPAFLYSTVTDFLHIFLYFYISILCNVVGISKKSMEAIHLDEDWDPDKYDKEMEQMFNDDYFEGGRTILTID